MEHGKRAGFREVPEDLEEPKAAVPAEGKAETAREAELLAEIQELKLEGENLRSEIVRLLSQREEARKKLMQLQEEEKEEMQAEASRKQKVNQIFWHVGLIILSVSLLRVMDGAAKLFPQILMFLWRAADYCLASPWPYAAVGGLILYLTRNHSR